MVDPQKQGGYLNDQDFSGAVNLTNCDKEPIHLPGSIQPHGYLIGFSAEGVIHYASNNLFELREAPSGDFVGSLLKEVIGNTEAAKILSEVQSLDKKNFFPLQILTSKGEDILFESSLHRSGEIFILELETTPDSEDRPEVDLSYINESLEQFQEAESLGELAEVAVKECKEISGFSRVMVYRFLEDGHGVVIAEEKERELDPYLGLHYPASDIPAQARKLYLLNPVRIIPDVGYAPVAIGSLGQDEELPLLDLSLAELRSVSPIHIQYLKNMGVQASMSVSIVRENKLWGLIAFHHTQPLHLSCKRRQLCLLLARAFTMVLGEKEESVQKKYRQRIEEVQEVLLQQMSGSVKFTEGLFKEKTTVQQLINCGGCVLLLGGKYISLGETPTEEQSRKLAEWLQKNMQEIQYETHQLPEVYPPALEFRDFGSGMLAIAISRVQQEYIIWFRPEKVRTVKWAGKPEKQESHQDGNLQLSPRNSFEVWSELVKNTSEPWLPFEIEAARKLRTTLVDLALRMAGELKLRADILSRINHEVDTDKGELDSFAYIVSHDLKEPLRGIRQYASFLLEDYSDRLDEEGQANLQTLVRLSKRMQQLVDSLLQFSRLGRMELSMREVNLKEIVEEVLEVFGKRITGEEVEWEIQEKWPVICCDSFLVSEIFMNLISNALKYNDKKKKQVVIGCRKASVTEPAPSGIVCFVKDNGIGVEEKFQKEVFHIFRRLHARDAYGGGTGAGLTISKKIVERHGGQMWIESEEGSGSTFWFSL